ncbi:hypothetical protein GYMLUDRAFT_45229 [Collybiopsis luxurians FD-317 M1]|uniref:RTA1-like protein n=1 Tax=Collybiopsis luxurians FD-317 M1 TaxID=944289 RepID=A0A0D0CJP5_9AGAR|nr:hypothetical protein GYMLUDRAFT_45229 [Collybiopsis luxurians FD-317 M1]
MAVDQDLASLSPYNYIPTEYVAIIFVTLFGISTALHTGQAIYSRTWWAFPTIVFAGILEIMGWSARLWSSISPLLLGPYEMQLTLTILAPTPFVAGNFVILGNMIKLLGPQYSRIPPRWYSIIFCSFDLISLIIQAVGGGLAATAAGQGKDPTPGGHIMLGGIVFQMATITIYVFCASEFFTRFLKDLPLRPVIRKDESGGASSDTIACPVITDADQQPEKDDSSIITPKSIRMSAKLKLMTLALTFSTLCLFIRAVYRTIELTNGWSGRIISTQVYFNVLDGTMIVLAIYTMNFVHPGLFLARSSSSSPSIAKDAAAV